MEYIWLITLPSLYQTPCQAGERQRHTVESLLGEGWALWDNVTQHDVHIRGKSRIQRKGFLNKILLVVWGESSVV